jgi:lipoprotein Spr/probable lipoprotein NlpC
MLLRFVMVACVASFFGCSTKMQPKRHSQPLPPPLLLQQPSAQKELPPYRLQKKNAITNALYGEYKKWYGVQYCWGGDDHNGIDCSALVQNIYKDAFGLDIPRTTKQQAKVGYWGAKRDLKEGDILLFKLGYNARHSGIYLERGNFIHASSSHGVRISNINNPYWKSKYWQSRRVLAR